MLPGATLPLLLVGTLLLGTIRNKLELITGFSNRYFQYSELMESELMQEENIVEE